MSALRELRDALAAADEGQTVEYAVTAWAVKDGPSDWFNAEDLRLYRALLQADEVLAAQLALDLEEA